MPRQNIVLWLYSDGQCSDFQRKKAVVCTSGFVDSGVRLLFHLMWFLTAFIFLGISNVDPVTQVSNKYEMHMVKSR